ncbi:MULTISPECIES: purine-cytosine permease family protein [unclassified Streptomyces]|uniref:purine-cytosine permease family protein n=1 Tax=unclassified Streptomyces TaxID=2593676 RepID=UPI0009A10A5B|nr:MULTISPECIES: cytosine permease [unclassified Streptomyces]
MYESRGLEPVPDSARVGRVRELFPTWVAANISVLLLTMGASLVVLHGLNFWQVLVVAAAAPVVSYGIVGLVSIAGKRGGAPGMALSRAAFGQRGNLLPGAVIWVARWGWEAVNAVTGAYALLTVADLLFGLRNGGLPSVVALLLFVGGTFLVSGLGIGALRWCCRWSAYLFGAFSLLVLGHLVARTDWAGVFGRPSGPVALMVVGVGTLTAGAISWAPSAPDFTRYLPRRASGAAVVGATVAGAFVVVVPLVLMGAVMAESLPGLASTRDPVSFIGELLPVWLSVPYLLIALVGTLLINALSMYSAGFTAQTLGFRLPRAWAVGLNAVISAVAGGVLMLVAQGFLAAFVSFLTLLGVAFSAWIGVFGADMLRRGTYDAGALLDTSRSSGYWYRGGFAWWAVAGWGAGLAVGLLFTRVEWFAGPLAGSWPGRHGLGWVLTAGVAASVYGAGALPGGPARLRARPAARWRGRARGPGRPAAPARTEEAGRGSRKNEERGSGD